MLVFSCGHTDPEWLCHTLYLVVIIWYWYESKTCTRIILSLLTCITTIWLVRMAEDSLLLKTPSWCSLSHECAFPFHLDYLGHDLRHPPQAINIWMLFLIYYSFFRNNSLHFTLNESMPKFSQSRLILLFSIANFSFLYVCLYNCVQCMIQNLIYRQSPIFSLVTKTHFS